MKMMQKVFATLLLLISIQVQASESTVFEYSVNEPLDDVYSRVYKGLEDDGFYVVFEANIGRSISRFADKWGDDYNQNKLDAMRSMVFCSGWYANQVSNKDPSMLALCPMRMTLIEKNGKTTALFAKPSVIAAHSPALPVLKRLEKEVTVAIQKSMDNK